MDKLVEVTEADREAAASLVTMKLSVLTAEYVRSGKADGYGLVEAFARHRVASTPTDAARVAPYPVAERAFHVVKSYEGDDDEYGLRIKDRATLVSFPVEKDHLRAHSLAAGLNKVVEFHVAAAIRALPAPPTALCDEEK